jgi:ATP dependent DNA ligase domain
VSGCSTRRGIWLDGSFSLAEQTLTSLSPSVPPPPIPCRVPVLQSQSRLKTRFVPPCLPSPAREPPAGSGWIHEIKHDGFGIMARRDPTGVRLYTRNGYDFAHRFSRIVEALLQLPVRSCFVDGEAIVVDERGLSTFDLLRSWRWLRVIFKTRPSLTIDFYVVGCLGLTVTIWWWMATLPGAIICSYFSLSTVVAVLHVVFLSKVFGDVESTERSLVLFICNVTQVVFMFSIWYELEPT